MHGGALQGARGRAGHRTQSGTLLLEATGAGRVNRHKHVQVEQLCTVVLCRAHAVAQATACNLAHCVSKRLGQAK